MASDGAFKYFRYTERQAFLKWRRLCARGRERQALNELNDVDMPPWKKRKLIREVIYYAGCSEYQPLMSLSVYDYETETEWMSDAASYCFSKTSSSASSSAASSSAEGSTTGTTEEVDESTTSSRSSVTVESSQKESVEEPAPKSISLPSLGTGVGSSLGQSVNGAARKSTDLRSSEPMEPSQEESVKKPAPKSISLPSLGTGVGSSLGQSVNGAARKSTDLRSSEPMESSQEESVVEPARKSINSRTSSRGESTVTESVNESTRKSTSSRTSGQSDSTITPSANETARKSTSLSSTELDVESKLEESINGEEIHKATALQTAGPVHSALEESVHKTAHNSNTTRTSRLAASSAAESVNEEINKASTLGTSELVDSSQDEAEFVTMEEWTTSEQNSPERTRRSDDFNAEILNLSPALSALKIVRETPEESDVGESMDQDSTKNVPFFKHGKLRSSSSSTASCSPIYTGLISNEGTCSASESSDHAESSPPPVLLIPSNVQPELQELARSFAEVFGCRVAWCDASVGSFDERVSHVMVDLDVPEPMQFAQCQASGCKRYLVSTNWLLDSLQKGRLLPQQPYEVIFCDEETSASIMAPSRLARLSSDNLFDGFAILLCRPFVNFNESLMKRLLVMNGARVCVHPRQLTESPDQVRLCIIDPKFYRKGEKSELLKLKSAKYKFAAVHYQWLFNSFLMYQVQPLMPYLHWAEPAQAVEAGVPEEFLEH